MKFKIGVFGSGSGSSQDNAVLAQANDIGRQIAEHDAIVVTGGCPGIPHMAATGAATHGGEVLGISPAINLRQHREEYGFPTDSFYTLIFTGMERKGRNPINLRTSDAAIFIAGQWGTMNEFTIAHDEAEEGFVIGILKGSGGVSDEILDLKKKIKKPTNAVIIEESNPIALVNKVFEALKKKRS